MAAGLGFKDFVTGEVLTAADVDGYLMQGIWVFASTAARDAAVTSPSEGNFAFTKDTNSLWYYDGVAWVASGATGDIEGVTAGIGISGGGTSGTVTVTNSMATAIDAKGDLVVGTGADTFSKLTVGANGTTLVADSSEATGLKWQAAAASSSGIGCSLSMSTTQIISGSTYTAILFNTEEFDTDSFHSTSTNTSRITIPTGKSGRYQVNASLAWSNVTGDLRNIVIYKNGSLYQECPYIAAGADGRTHAQTSLVMDLVATDYIEVYAYQNKGTTVGIWGNDTYAKGTNFSVALL